MYAKCNDCGFKTRYRTARANHEHSTGHKMSEYFEVSIQSLLFVEKESKESPIV